MKQKSLTYRTLLKVETGVSLVMSLLFLSTGITGMAVSSGSGVSVSKIGLIFLGLGLIGLATLFFTSKKK